MTADVPTTRAISDEAAPDIESLYVLQVLTGGEWWSQVGESWSANEAGLAKAKQKASQSVLTCRVVLLSPALPHLAQPSDEAVDENAEWLEEVLTAYAVEARSVTTPQQAFHIAIRVAHAVRRIRPAVESAYWGALKTRRAIEQVSGVSLSDYPNSVAQSSGRGADHARHLITAPHDGHDPDETCPACPHRADDASADHAREAAAWDAAVREARSMGTVENEAWFFDALSARNPYRADEVTGR